MLQTSKVKGQSSNNVEEAQVQRSCSAVIGSLTQDLILRILDST